MVFIQNNTCYVIKRYPIAHGGDIVDVNKDPTLNCSLSRHTKHIQYLCHLLEKHQIIMQDIGCDPEWLQPLSAQHWEIKLN